MYLDITNCINDYRHRRKTLVLINVRIWVTRPQDMNSLQNPRESFKKFYFLLTGSNLFRNFSHCVTKPETMSKSSEFSTSESDKEVSSHCTSSTVNVLNSGTNSVGTCEMMGLGCSTD